MKLTGLRKGDWVEKLVVYGAVVGLDFPHAQEAIQRESEDQ